jgi:dipeptidyl-peptidase 4
VNQSSCEEYQPDFLTRKVLNLDVTFHWLAGSDRFWFKRQTRAGEEFVAMDCETGDQSLTNGVDSFGAEIPDTERGMAPNGRHIVLRRGNDLWLRDALSGEERRITHDGEPDFSYGSGDVSPYFAQQLVAHRRAGSASPLCGVLWSPDSRFVVALRQDFRPFPERLFVTEYVPPKGMYIHPHLRRVPLACDAQTPDTHLVVFDTQALVLHTVALDPQALNDYALLYFLDGIVWWNTDRNRLFVITANRGGSHYALNSIDLESGESQEILHESARFNVRLNPFDYARPNVYVVSDGTECIWYSERSGYGHLYLYDTASGLPKRQITCGDWVVFDLLRVDESQRLAYFTAATRTASGTPYYRYLYLVSLEGGQPQLLTPEIADHNFNNHFGPFRHLAGGDNRYLPGSCVSPSGRYFVDSYSTTDQPPEYVLRRMSGELVAKVLSSDASELYRSGWMPPERVVAKAADGVTDLYGVITKPRDFDGSRRYPIVDSMYPGPQGSFAPRSFKDQLAGGSIHHLQTFADAGFIVLAIDARGTAHRSREFRDAFLGTEDVFGAADHVAAIKYLAAQRPYIDLERIGVRGQSFGGYGSLRAMLLYPDFFKVAVSATGPDGYFEFPSGISVERFFGVPSASTESRVYYDLISNTQLALRLKGRVLLIYAGIDENVPLKHAFATFDAFVKADKDVDILIIPDLAHAVPREPYVIRRSVQYFLSHLATLCGALQRED